MILEAKNWEDYELINTGDGDKLERWGNVILRRPDPQIIWPVQDVDDRWVNPDAVYHRSEKGGGSWAYNKKTPKKWNIKYKDLIFNIQPTGFKHTGLFPEQAVNWDWMMDKIQNANRNINVLNLFAYTGGATVACAYAGASVCHVDASKGMIQWAKENIESSKLKDKEVRFITDDALKFVRREIRRGKKYDGIIMDPPSYGRGPKGELWKIEDEIFNLIQECKGLLSENPLFFLVNSYTTGFSPQVIENILEMTIQKTYRGNISSGEVGLRASSNDIILPCGIYGRWEEK